MRPVPHVRQLAKHLIWKLGWDLRPFRTANGLDGMLWRLLEKLDVNCVIDDGAHNGEFGMLVRALGYHGRLASCEPTRAALTDLRPRSQQAPEWPVYGMALGSASGTVPINVNCDSRFSSCRDSSTLGRSLFEHQLTTATIERVELRRLDDLFREV